MPTKYNSDDRSIVFANNTCIHALLKIFLLIPFLSISFGSDNQAHSPSWQDCETYFAPSSLPSRGWGIFAARDFDTWEIVDISHLFIPMGYTPTIRNSVLDDYIYGYLRWHADKREMEKLACVVFGNGMFYNHHPEPNIKWLSFGREPNPNEPNIAQANGFVARRKIVAGEELFTSYGEEDGGVRWFQNRKLDMVAMPAYLSRRNGTGLERDKGNYCSKIYAGIGRPSWTDRVQASIFPGVKVPFFFDNRRLAPHDHPDAVVKQDVISGATLEIVPALIMSKDLVANTALAPTSFFWDDWDVDQQKALRELRDNQDLRVQYRSDTGLIIKDNFTIFEDVVVLPVAGNVALIDRVGKASISNCEIKIMSSGGLKFHPNSGSTGESAGILLHLVATKDIKAGNPLRLNVGRADTSNDMKLLVNVLAETGNVAPHYLQRLQDRIGFDNVYDEL